MKNKKTKKRGRKIIFAAAGITAVLCLAAAFLFIEDSIHSELNKKWPGDCGHFAVWAASLFYENILSPAQITMQISPWVVVTGPATIKEELAKINISSVFYNNFTTEGIKKKLDENKLVILLINLNSTEWTSAGATHYIFIYKRDNEGVYFSDSYFWLPRYLENKTTSSYFMTYEEIESRWRNVMQRRHFIGKIQNAIGMNNFAIVIGEESRNEEKLNPKIRFAFAVQHAFEGVIEAIGRFVVWLSPRL